MYSWSRFVEFDESNKHLVTRDCCKMESFRGHNYDLSVPREWLEYEEARNGGQCGAYTVMRCDLLSNSSWRLWESDFHIQRLSRSYTILTEREEDQHEALSQTAELLQELLVQAETHLLDDTKGEVNGSCCVCMVTLLWQPEAISPFVRGHICSSGIFTNPIDYDPPPITACLAISPNAEQDLPNRHSVQPTAKFSSWCRRRHKLEDDFKRDGVQEVLMVRKMEDGRLELLEGLTSNVFVLYRDGTLRTCATGVLEGCARMIVLRAAKSLGWKVELSPIVLENVNEWKEVFLTASSRLILPVGTIVRIQDYYYYQVLWNSSSSKWKMLYQSIFET